MPITGNQISQELLSALGLPKHVTAFSLHVRAGDIVTVDCEYYPDDLPALEKALAKYSLVRIGGDGLYRAAEHPAVAMGFDAWMRERTEAAHVEFMRRTNALSSERRKYANGGLVTGFCLVGENL